MFQLIQDHVEFTTNTITAFPENEQDQVSPFANLLTSNDLTASYGHGRMGRAQALLIPLQVGRRTSKPLIQVSRSQTTQAYLPGYFWGFR